MELSGNALKVLEARYLLKDENGDIIKSPKDVFGRIARTIAGAEKLYNSNATLWEERFSPSSPRSDFSLTPLP